MYLRHVALAVLSLTFFEVRLVSAATSYDIIELSTLPDSDYSQAFGINAVGQVFGSSGSRSFLYNNGSITDLTTLGGYNCVANGINTSGQVVGFSDAADNPYPRAFLYSNGAITSLGTFPDGVASYAYGINDSGQVAGWAYTANRVEHAFLYDKGQMNDIGVIDGFQQSYAYGINNNGQVVGTSYAANGQQHAFLYSSGQMIDLNSRIDSSLGLIFFSAVALNDSGQVAGGAAINGTIHAIRYDNGVASDLGVLPGDSFSDACGINSAGQVVGYSYSPNTQDYRAFLFNGEGMVDLNDSIDPTSNWTLQFARGINDSGWIVGSGQHNGRERGFLMIPIPEPATITLLAVGATAILSLGLGHIKRSWPR